MIVYWAMLAMSLLTGMFAYASPLRTVWIEERKQSRTSFRWALLLFVFIIFFCGFRDVVLDTYTYKTSFYDMPIKWDAMIAYVERVSTGKGYYFVMGCFKLVISNNHYVWFFFLAIISCMCLLRVLYKYSVDFPLTGYLFVASTSFVWLINGTRQFLVVCILFAFVDLVLKGKKWLYCLLIFLMTTVHTSAIFVAPIALLIDAKKFLSWKTMIIIVVAVVGTYFSEQALGVVGEFLDKDYTESLERGTGSNIIRFLVNCVPATMAIVWKRRVDEGPKSIILAANMSIVTACFSLASTFTNGILVGRMTIYFSIYSLYFLPWIIKKVFDSQSGRIVWWLCVVLYGIYFYYQIMVAWGGLPYVSDILGIG